jgi:hypothetical protein
MDDARSGTKIYYINQYFKSYIENLCEGTFPKRLLWSKRSRSGARPDFEQVWQIERLQEVVRRSAR